MEKPGVYEEVFSDSDRPKITLRLRSSAGSCQPLGRWPRNEERIDVGLSNFTDKISVDGNPQPVLLRFYRQGPEVVSKEEATIGAIIRDRVPVA